MSTPHIFKRPALCPWLERGSGAEAGAKKAIVQHSRKIEALLQSRGSNVNSPNGQGVALIQTLVLDSKPLDLAAILVLGANTSVLDQKGNGLLHLAVQQDYNGDLAKRISQLKCVQLLLGYSLKPNFANEDGNTPFHLAVQSGASMCIGPLLNADDSMINAINNEGQTAAQIAEHQ